MNQKTIGILQILTGLIFAGIQIYIISQGTDLADTIESLISILIGVIFLLMGLENVKS